MTDINLLNALVSAYGGDAIFRPSSIDRLFGCAGSVQLIARAPRDRRSTKYTREGQAAHVIVEKALKGERQTEEWTDRMVQLDDKGQEGEFVNEEMVDAANFYLNEVAERWTPTTEQFIERKLSLAGLDPSDPTYAQNRGTADVLMVDRPRRKLTIIDLKYGKGVPVSAGSPQLSNYALLGLIEFGLQGGWEQVETVVVRRGCSMKINA